jgi:ribose-phosphate pyrophosphokinase
VSLDIHSGQIQGFFDVPMDNIYAINVLIQYLRTLISVDSEYVLLSMDAGGEKRIKAYADIMKLPYVICTKQRDYSVASSVVKTNINCPAEFIKGKILIAVDDIIDTAGTVKSLVNSLREGYEFKEIWTVFTHGIFSGPAVENMQTLEGIVTKIIVTNSIDQTHTKAQFGDLLHVVDVSGLLTEVIRRIIYGGSISELFRVK